MNTTRPGGGISPDPSQAGTLEDLEAMQVMATYLRSELLRVRSDGFWLVASLPKMLEQEIAAVRKGKRRTFGMAAGMIDASGLPS